MNPKITKLLAEREKNSEKIAKLNARNDEIDKQVAELENLDIVGIVRRMGVTPDELAAMHDIMERAAVATAREFDNDYRGVLYGGFMLTPEGPKIIEFNARFGDPETQVVLPRLESDLADIMLAVAEGRPDDIDLRWSEQWAVCVVLASEGYPGSYEKGKVILGIDEAEQIEGVTVFHAGTAKNFDDELVTAGGRVLNVVALGDSFDDAREKAYEACDLINFEGKQYRSDIGKRAAAGRAAWEN